MAVPTVRLVALLLASIALTSACGSKPAPAPPVPVPEVPLDTKVAWILRLEQQRVLRDSPPAEAPPVAGVESPASQDPPAAAAEVSGPAPARTADLVALVNDTDPSVRRRAALAIGRVGQFEGVPPLVAALADADEGVRAMAAFGLGLSGSADAREPLQAALEDPSAEVRARAIEALGLVGDPAAAAAIADAAAGCAASLGGLPPDQTEPPSPEAQVCQLALFALVRLGEYDQLARVALDAQGQPISFWWPVAYALQRSGDTRAAPPLLTLASVAGVSTPAFALRGLGDLGEAGAAPIARQFAASATADIRLRAAAIRALGQMGGGDALEPLIELARTPETPRNLALEAVAAIGALGDPRGFDPLLDLLSDSWPAMRAAALAAAARTSPDGFLLVASGLPPDSDWSVRAALASVLSTFPADQVRTRLIDLTADHDARVRAPALRALAEVGAPDLAERLFEALQAEDFVVRAAAAELIGDAQPAGGIERLVAAYGRGAADAEYAARAAALGALAAYGTEDARAVVRQGLEDRAWPVRLRAAELLRELGETEAEPARPAPLRQPASYFESAELLHPAYSPHAFLETSKGTLEIELNLVEAPITSRSFIELARLGFYHGKTIHRVVPNFVVQAGDPRGDGEGGPGFTLRDELGPLPYVRGTVGMALDWRDTGGSQFFITVSPQPHLDARYTVFGRVVNGAEVLDQLSQWDTIERVRIWDGVSFE